MSANADKLFKSYFGHPLLYWV